MKPSDGVNSKVREAVVGPSSSSFTGVVAHRAIYPSKLFGGMKVRNCTSLGKTHRSLAAHLQGQLIAAGLQDARVAPRALQAMKSMSRHRLSGLPAASLAVAQGMVAIFTGQPADEAARPLERALTSMGAPTENSDMLAALWWCLLTAERFDAVAHAIESVVSEPIARVVRAGWWRSTAPWTC